MNNKLIEIMVEFIQFEAHDVDNIDDDEVSKMDEEVSSFIDDSSFRNDTSIYNCNIPNIRRSYEDAMSDKSLIVENSNGENFNYIFYPDSELDGISEITDDHPNIILMMIRLVKWTKR